MKREEINSIKLTEIYEEIFNLKWDIEKTKLENRKKELKKEIENMNRELEEINMISNDYWNRKEQMMREFNRYEVQCEENQEMK